MLFRSGVLVLLVLLLWLPGLQGCGPKPCASVFDCPTNQVCQKNSAGKGTCVDKKTRSEQTGTDAGGDASLPEKPEPNTPDLVTDTPASDEPPVEVTPEPPPLPKPSPGDLVINELLADPAGDANKDGETSFSKDEFVEIYNTADRALDLSGVKVLGGKKGELFVFPPKTILKSKQFAVIFSGGTPKAEDFNGALIFVKTLQLSNTGDTISLQSADGADLDRFEYGAKGCEGGKDQSVNRCGDFKAGTCQLHKSMSPTQAAFSPGAMADPTGEACKPQEPTPEVTPDGGPDSVSDATPDTISDATPDSVSDATPDTVSDAAPDSRPDASPDSGPDAKPDWGISTRDPIKGDLVINEVLADPDTDATKGDANGDGKRDSKEDEFIEIVNASSVNLMMKDVEIVLEDSSFKQTRYFVFPSLLLKPKDVVVVFGGGNVAGVTRCSPTVFTTKSSAPALSNSGRTVIVRNARRVEIDRFKYTKGATSACPGDQNESVNRSPALTSGTCSLHSKLSSTKALFSPGTKSDGTCF